MHKDLSAAFNGLLDELGSVHEMPTEVLPWHIVHLQDFVFEYARKSWVDATQRLQDMRDPMLLQECFILSCSDIT